MNNFLHFINVLEIIEDHFLDSSSSSSSSSLSSSSSSSSLINEKVPREDETVHLFTDIFKEKALPDEMNVPTPTPEGRGGFSLHMANYYKWLGQDQDRNYIDYIPAIAIGICFLFIASAALLGYISVWFF